MEFDLFTLLPLAAAVFVFWKLRSVLGTRNGNEQPPYQPYDNSNAKPDRSDDNDSEAADNVVTLPGANRRRSESDTSPQLEAIAKLAGRKTNLKKGLTAILSRDPSFDVDQFLSGARMAYEMIVTGFADGDKTSLKGLLSREVFENFEAVIDERSERNERVEASFIGIDKAEITSADVDKDDAQITVKFVSQMISATLDGDGEVIEGDKQQVAEITDIWTFARPVKSRDPNWKLVATDE